ncbi:MAG TPA: hypothetical protein PK770_03370 [Kiritimatiellia bacterium]|nr:hypothetical protein [Kiritimatiellia bacterium]
MFNAQLLLRDCSVRPVANEMELPPSSQQPELLDFMVQNGIQPVGPFLFQERG